MSVSVETAYAVNLLAFVVSAYDPCSSVNYREFPSQDIGARQEGCLSSVFEECDYYLNDTMWYKSSLGKLLTHCPRDRSCGSPLPAWIDGSYPDEKDGLVNRTICIKKESHCCYTKLTMEIKNCSTFAVFRLPRLSSCPSAYCFESNLPCETTTVTHLVTQTQSNEDNDYSLLIGMLIGGGVVFVCITSGIILYSKLGRKPQKISTEQYPVVILSDALPT